MNDNASTPGPQSRRDLLKKLGVAAGALVWSTPVVQTLTAASAGAQSGCYDISHLDLIITRDGKGPYGVQWDPGEGWSKHPTSQKHCLAGQSWTQPPSSVLPALPTPVKSGDSYLLTGLPANIQVVAAYSKAGQQCQPASPTVGGWQFDKWCPGATTTSTTSTTVPPATSSTTSTTTVGGGAGGSPGPSHDISHMDLVVKLASSSSGTWYGVQYEFGSGWSKHPRGNANKEHCLFGRASWSGLAPSSVLNELKKTVVSPIGSGKYLFEMPTTIVIRPAPAGSGFTHEAFSKCASDACTPATVTTSGSTQRVTFRPCPKS